uniref:NADH dehydrogenase [ubiquinone] flavoprotein 3, mitochondrial n=1 Tax=Clytia hemisphaerica TaxID=252671 RepID=A0A7M6DM72_9CNID
MSSTQLIRSLRQPLQQCVYRTTVRSLSTARTVSCKVTDKGSVDVGAKQPSPAAEPSIPQDQAAFDEYNANYKCPEYYKYDEFAFYDIENDMQSSRIEQPSAL